MDRMTIAHIFTNPENPTGNLTERLPDGKEPKLSRLKSRASTPGLDPFLSTLVDLVVDIGAVPTSSTYYPLPQSNDHPSNIHFPILRHCLRRSQHLQ